MTVFWPDSRAVLFFWSSPKVQYVWIWGAFVLIRHSDNKALFFRSPTRSDRPSAWIWGAFAMIGHVCVWPDHKALFFWLPMSVFWPDNKALLLPAKFQSAWILRAFALIGHVCVLTWQQSIVFLIAHLVPVCMDMGGLCSDWPQLPGEGGAASARYAGSAHWPSRKRAGGGEWQGTSQPQVSHSARWGWPSGVDTVRGIERL